MANLKRVFFGVASLALAAWTSVSYAGGSDLPNDVPSVPEPTTLLLLAGGAGAAGLARWLRKRK